MNAAKILTCTCCGAEITAPQFYNGKPYGWTCIKKVAPAQKQVKLKFFAVDNFKVVRERVQFGGDRQKIFAAEFIFAGKKHFGSVFESQMTEQNGVTFIREDVFKK